LPALEQALKELGMEDSSRIEILEKMKNGEALLPDGRRVECEMFFDEVNYDNLCVLCTISE